MIKKYVAGSKHSPKAEGKEDEEEDDIRMDFQALCNGILAGLVSITANCDAVDSWAAVVIGLLGAVFYSLACRFMNYVRVDDPLEATQVHGFCGIWGCVATAFFHKEKGIFYGAPKAGQLLGIQLLGCVSIIAWVGILSAIFFGIARYTGFLRLDQKDEILGGDIHYFAPIKGSGNSIN